MKTPLARGNFSVGRTTSLQVSTSLTPFTDNFLRELKERVDLTVQTTPQQHVTPVT